MDSPNHVALKRYKVDGWCNYAPQRSSDAVGYHCDCEYNDVLYVVGVSLLSDSTLVFRRNGHVKRESIFRRGIYSMVDEALFDWKHALFDIRPPGRVSVTYRLVRK
mmetsp:Transcript_126199/g.200162  ORF Transcript_126199/g.200162 Transcript_126199/m.200162 type:complete len:106 (+) Transcript_126199:1-318(+)